ncbi:hypothetical protein [Caldisalinibacter kiritimatiensis]|uniref:Uncharacterized protein n=1 Tax=Caldisalinibacter kiritimatiensis TaxID=1304284 RepID=R1ATJ7_9FIRM|nr:hypothetical protein [Caldisalinibacter kiritimatiensis]EOC99951.1 hypothetical protein L21TH_1996 [Caldisalinibacter kiritimatiensis]
MVINKIKITFLVFMIILIIIISANNVYSDSENKYNSKKTYVLILNRTTLEDIYSMNNLLTLINEGSIGLMNTRGLYGYDGPESYITINASTRCYANYSTTEFFNININEKKMNEYITATGIKPRNYSIANLKINKILKLNKNNKYSPNIGALGDCLHKEGLKTAVFGNSDTADSFIRTNCLIAMDSKGLIDYGNVDNVLIEDKYFPYGVKTNYNKILNELKGINKKASLIVIEEGDLNRLNLYKELLSDEMFIKHKKKILQRADEFIGDLLNIIDKNNSRMIITSPNSGEKIEGGVDKLTPIIIWGDGIKSGIVTSKTTRRQGIVSNIDIAPSITNYIGINSDKFSGERIESLEYNDNLSFIKELLKRTEFISKIRYSTLSIFCILTIMISLITTSLVLIEYRLKSIFKNVIIFSLILILTTPITLLLMSLFKIDNIYAFIVAAVAFVTILTIMIYRINIKNRILFITGFTYLIIIVDIISGGNLIKFSTLGYDPIIGARYFGIGNELSGVLIGCMFIFWALILEKIKRRYFILIFLIYTIVLVIAPNYGANLGATLSLIGGTIYFVISIYKINLDFKTITLFLLITIAFIMGFTIIDFSFSFTTSHLGKLVTSTINNGIKTVYDVISRKLYMNIKLLGVTIWSKVLLVNLICLILLIRFKNRKLKTLFKEKNNFFIGLTSALVSSTIGFITNDSGVLLASIANIFILNSLLYVTIEYTEETNTNYIKS